MQGKRIFFMNIKNTGRWHYSTLGSYVLKGGITELLDPVLAKTPRNKAQRNVDYKNYV